MELKCRECGVIYNSNRNNSKFCSIKCKNSNNRYLVNCSWCGKEKEIYKSSYKEGKRYFCDNKCQWNLRKKEGEMIGESHPLKKEWAVVYCGICNKEFEIPQYKYNKSTNKNFYCSKKCNIENNSKRINENHPRFSKIELVCDNCGKSFLKKKSQVGNKNFCNKDCYTAYIGDFHNRSVTTVYCNVCNKPKIISNSYYINSTNKIFYCNEHSHLKCAGSNNYNWKGITILECSFCGREFERRTSIISASENNNQYCSDYCMQRNKSILFSGENHPRWNGGQKSISNYIRYNIEYAKIRDKCFKRDNYSSVASNIVSLVTNGLHHHHIKSLSSIIKENNITFDNVEDFYDILYDINNVATLLREEHLLFHSLYGWNNNKYQFEDFKLRIKYGEI